MSNPLIEHKALDIIFVCEASLAQEQSSAETVEI